MVWPFSRGEDNSLDSFERILAKLASQIQTQTSKLGVLRQHARRYKGMFTLYGVVGWILYVIVIVLIVGWKEARPQEIGGVIGGPVGIWLIRRLLDLYYNNRIGNAESKLDYLQKKQRDTVEKLIDATKFSTTQSIIEKYGGGPKSKEHQQGRPGPQEIPGQKRPMGPPGAPGVLGPTNPKPPTTTQQQIQQQLLQQQMMAQEREQQPPHTGNPNPVQKSAPPPTPVINVPQIMSRQPSSQQHIQQEEDAGSQHWYDRLLDILVGEDEMSAKNRYALICKNCRMVNGLAPPGTRSLEEMEGWDCVRCHTMNGKVFSRPPSRLGDELSLEIGKKEAKGRRTRSPTPNENVRTTRSKAKKEEVEEKEAAEEEEEEEEEVEEESSEASEGEEVEQPRKKRTPKANRNK